MKQKLMTRLLALSTAVMMGLAGCGGSGAGAGGPGLSEQGTGGATAGSITVGASSPTISSDGANPVEISAAVKSLSNVGMADQTVAFSTTDAGSVISVVGAKTDASGVATATLKITDPTARAIEVKARSAEAEGSVVVQVAGTNLTVSGQQVLAFNGRSTYVVSVRNANNTGLSGIPVQLRSERGNLVSPLTSASATSDAAGQAKFSVEGRIAGADTLEAKALGVMHTLAVTVSGDVASFDSPTPAGEALVNESQDVAIRFLSGGQPLAGSTVNLTSTRGTLAATSGVTDSDGYFRTTLLSAQAGYATISAAIADGPAASVDFEFVSKMPSSIAVQASPTTVSANPTGSTSNTSELIARVRDSAGNPVKGIRVDFTANPDPSGGTISPAFALTNSAGVASTAFIAGPNASGPNGVAISARVSGTAIAASPALLTTVAEAMMVRMNTGNEIQTPDSTTYLLPWAVVVSDAAGSPVAGAKVTASYRPTRFWKGEYGIVGTQWSPQETAVCFSEDGAIDGVPQPATNPANGVLDIGEDYDGDGVLEPGNVATIYVTSEGGVTDVSGFANLAIKYPRGFANWAEIEFQVTITAPSGTEVRTTRVLRLVPASADVTNITNSPPGGIDSPFGTLPGCDVRG